MYRIIPLLFIICTAESANYQRYGESTMYPGASGYNSYSSMSTYPNQYQQNGGSYGSDMANFPEATRYPNYSPGYSTNSYNSYNSYSTPRPGFGGSSYQNTYSTQRYGDAYGGSSYQNTYSTQRYGDAYGGRSYSPYEMPFMKDIRGYCVNRSPQTGIWVDSLMGMWYGVEYVQHLAGDSRVDYDRSCIVIHLAEPVERPSTEHQPFHEQHINAKFRQEYRHLRLLWDEGGRTIEYTLYFRNNSAGYWQAFGRQNGTIPSRPSYQQFSGTVQVLKAVSDHLVLNFCQEANNGRPAQLYSVLFTREPGFMARWELDSIHALLQNKKLSVASRRMVCGNSAGRSIYSLILSVILLTLNYAVSSS